MKFDNVFVEFESLKNVIDEYYSKMKPLKEEMDKTREKKYPGQEAYIKEVKDIKSRAQKLQNRYKEKLTEVYEKEQVKIKGKVNFGSGDPQETAAELEFADELEKTELNILAEKYDEQNNYLGLKKLQKITDDKGFMLDVKRADIDEELEDLEKYYKGKQRRFTGNPLDDTSNMSRMRSMMGLK